MSIYYQDDQTALHLGDSLEVLRTLQDASVDCCVTSPPYFGLRDYGLAGQIGAESSPAVFVSALVAVFAEVRRVLADDGTLWLNLGDSYATKPVGKFNGGSATVKASGLPEKSLLMMPARVAMALQDDGWILRNDIIWAKPNGMPESVTDRLSTKHEHMFLFAKSRRYWFDLDPVREPGQDRGAALTWEQRKAEGAPMRYGTNQLGSYGGAGVGTSDAGRNPGDVWNIPTQPFPEAHFATYPLELPRRAIAAGCKPGGTVLDPFSGSGTTGLAASQLGRKYVGIDLNRDYLDLSLRTRLAQPSLTAEASA